MILKVTERYYVESRNKWMKHGSFDKDIIIQNVKRTTVWFLFIPLFWWEKIIKCNL